MQEAKTESRRAAIADYVLKKNTATVQELSQQFGVSMVTMRADLSALEKLGVIKRQHGGAAVPQEDLPGTLAFQARARINQEAKRLIGEAAAALVHDGDSLMIDSSTTGFFLARALRHKRDLRVVTNGINTALELLKAPHTTIFVGGLLNERTYGTVGRLGKSMLDGIRVQKAFMGARGISVKNGLTDSNLLEGELKQLIADIANELVAIVDSSKFRAIGFATFAPIERVSTVVTDSSIPSGDQAALEALGIHVILAGPAG